MDTDAKTRTEKEPMEDIFSVEKRGRLFANVVEQFSSGMLEAIAA